MCNRFCSIKDPFLIRQYATVIENLDDYIFNPNVAPTNNVPIIRSAENQQRCLGIARFGISPHWAKNANGPSILMNARVETLYTKRTYKNLMAKSRCAIPVEGYYEWREEEGEKQPYLFTRNDGNVMWLAGLWDQSVDKEQHEFVIITGEPNSLSSPIHDRMPCIIDNTDIERWLDVTQNGDDCLIIYPSEFMQVRPVNRSMNRSSMKDFRIIDNVETVEPHYA